jgi:hypothetical protein
LLPHAFHCSQFELFFRLHTLLYGRAWGNVPVASWRRQMQHPARAPRQDLTTGIGVGYGNFSARLWPSFTDCADVTARFLRPSTNRSSSAINSGLLCLPPLWISSSLCINSAKFTMTFLQGWHGWFKAGSLAGILGDSQARKLIKSEQC